MRCGLSVTCQERDFKGRDVVDSRFIVDRVAAVILDYRLQFSAIPGAVFFTFNAIEYRLFY